MARRDTTGYFGVGNTAIPMSVPHNASIVGLTILDRKLKQKTVRGLRGNEIPFQFIDNGQPPPWSKKANWEEYDAIGRFEMMQAYKNSSNQDVPLKIKYYAEGSEELGHKTFWTIEQIARIRKKIESLTFPQYDGLYSGPPMCLLNIGSMYIDMPVIITSVSAQDLPPYTIDTMKPMRMEIQIDMKSAYPLYQSIGGGDVMKIATDRGSFKTANGIYSFKSFSSTKNR